MTEPDDHMKRSRLTRKRLQLLRKIHDKDPFFRRRVTCETWIDQYNWARKEGLVKFDASGSLILTPNGQKVLDDNEKSLATPGG
jgi:putative SOS response-associated peptidase YedK